MLIYRLISWILLAIIGWILFFFLFRGEGQIDPDATAERGGIDADPRRREEGDWADDGMADPDP
jgi:hypothetical protein